MKVCLICRKKSASQERKGRFLLRDSEAQYRIISLNREGNLICIDKQKAKIFTESPYVIANTKYIISKFNNSQACYIGFLAGSFVEKEISRKNRDSDSLISRAAKMAPLLRVVD